MDKDMVNLFREMARHAEISAEQVAEYDRNKEDEQGEKTALVMRDDYIELGKKIESIGSEGAEPLNRNDYAKLLAAAYIVINALEGRIKMEENAIHGYKVDILPRLNRIITETEDDETAMKLADELFTSVEISQDNT